MFNLYRKTVTATSVLSLCVALYSLPANASVSYMLEGSGPISTGMGGTGASFNIGNSGMIDNPATLLMMPLGQNLDANVDMLSVLKVEFKDLATGVAANSYYHGDNNNPFFLPSVSYSLVLPKWAFGVGVFPGGGLGVNYGASSWLSGGTGKEISDRFVGLRIPFAVAYQPTSRLAIGGAFDLIYEGLNLSTFIPGSQLGGLASEGLASGSIVGSLSQIPNLRGGYVNFSRDSPIFNRAEKWGVGGRIGLTYAVFDNTHIGIAFNFRSDVGNLTGKGSLTAITSDGELPLSGKYVVRHFELPPVLTVGISSQVTAKTLLAFDFKRYFLAETNKFLSLGFVANNGGNLNANIPTYSPNVSTFALGGAYFVSKALTLRAGVQYAQESQNPEYLSSLLPGILTWQGTAGVGYQIDQKSQINAAFEYAQAVVTGYQSQTSHRQFEIGIGYSRNF